MCGYRGLPCPPGLEIMKSAEDFVITVVYGSTISLLVGWIVLCVMYLFFNRYYWTLAALALLVTDLAIVFWVFRMVLYERFVDNMERVVVHRNEITIQEEGLELDKPQFVNGWRLPTDVIAPDILYQVTCRLLTGGSFTTRAFTRGKQKMMSLREFEELRGKFFLYGWMDWRDRNDERQGVRITSDGWRAFQAIKKLYETTPLLKTSEWEEYA